MEVFRPLRASASIRPKIFGACQSLYICDKVGYSFDGNSPEEHEGDGDDCAEEKREYDTPEYPGRSENSPKCTEQFNVTRAEHSKNEQDEKYGKSDEHSGKAFCRGFWSAVYELP